MSFRIKQNDTSPSLQATLKDASSNGIDLSGATVLFRMNSFDGTVKVESNMSIVDADNGVVRYDWQPGDTDTNGTYLVEFRVTYVDGKVETFPNTERLSLIVTKGN